MPHRRSNSSLDRPAEVRGDSEQRSATDCDGQYPAATWTGSPAPAKRNIPGLAREPWRCPPGLHCLPRRLPAHRRPAIGPTAPIARRCIEAPSRTSVAADVNDPRYSHSRAGRGSTRRYAALQGDDGLSNGTQQAAGETFHILALRNAACESSLGLQKDLSAVEHRHCRPK